MRFDFLFSGKSFFPFSLPFVAAGLILVFYKNPWPNPEILPIPL
jgi:hypothetical protein